MMAGVKEPCQHGEDGACKTLFLSLLTETYLLSHPMLLDLYRKGSRLTTSGNVVRQIQFNTLKQLITEATKHENPIEYLEKSIACFKDSNKHESKKHVARSDFDYFESGPPEVDAA